MEIKILDDKKNKLIVEAKGIGHTLCNVIKSELWNDKDVAVAGYTLEHPLIGSSILIVETSKGDPKKALLSAIDRLKKKNKEYMSAVKKAAK